MKIKFQMYQFWKIKNYIKTNKLFFFFNSSRIKSNKWIIADQLIKKTKLNYYTVHNNSMLNIISPSIYKNISQMICSIFLLIKQNNNQTPLILKNINSLKPLFEPLSMKLNNKVYSIKQCENIIPFNYIKKIKSLNKLLIISSRMSIKQTLIKSK